MGIRFPCHACNKRLNVKAFLAGKRGICPHCGTKVDIPWQSVDGDANGAEAGGSTIVPQSVVASAKPNGASHVSVAPSVQAGSGSPSPSGVPMAIPTTPSVPTSNPASPHDAAIAEANPSPSAPVASAVPVAQASVAAPPPADIPPNPIDEAPNAVWYVRPPSGGQYGPASGEIMKKWLGEGRVSSDSLVWREGWADWKTASSLFAELGGPAQSAAPPAGSGPPEPSTATPTPSFVGNAAATGVGAEPGAARPYVKRRSNNSLAMVIVILLTLASLGLFGVLIAVINWMQ